MKGYRTIKVLGEGTFGKVTLAKCQETNQLVAVKTSKPKLAANVIALMLQESEILESIDHPHIVRFLGLHAESPRVVMAMEYCAGGDLRGLLDKAHREGTPFSQRHMFKIFQQLIMALHHCHHAVDGRTIILHRDIKPENILLAQNDTVKLADFGLGKVIAINEAGTQSFVGTRGYLAPEVLQGRTYDSKADMFSLGCVLQEMATFRPPSENNSGFTETRRAPQEAQTDSELFTLVSQLLSPNPKYRPSTADIFATRFYAEWSNRRDCDHAEMEHPNLIERENLLKDREIKLEKAEGQLREREKRLKAKEASLEAEYRRLSLRRSASRGLSKSSSPP